MTKKAGASTGSGTAVVAELVEGRDRGLTRSIAYTTPRICGGLRGGGFSG
jgi:hypothetical protein